MRYNSQLSSWVSFKNMNYHWFEEGVIDHVIIRFQSLLSNEPRVLMHC